MKTIFLTGSTDGIGLATAKTLARENHLLLLHGRSQEKLTKLKDILREINPDVNIKTFAADLSNFKEVKQLTKDIIDLKENIDVIINNAGINVACESDAITKDNIDIRIAVNTIAPFIITNNLLGILNDDSRVVNVASAAQMPVDINFLNNEYRLSDSDAYAVSKLAIIMWSIEMAKTNKSNFISVNPKSYLGSKMVKTAYNIDGYDLQIGADILIEAALSDKFKFANGKYYDNDYMQFDDAHPFAYNQDNRNKLMEHLNKYL